MGMNAETNDIYGHDAGYGFGVAVAYAHGYGYGSGYGHGSGHGCGSGEGDDWLAFIPAYAGPAGDAAIAAGATLALWKSDADGQPCNGGSGDPVAIGDVQEVDGPLEICTRRALHGTHKPKAWKGTRLWVVALYPPIQVNEDALASLRREIICEICVTATLEGLQQ